MNKSQLIELMAEKVKLAKSQAEMVLDTLTKTITETIKAGGEVTITGFGTFSAKQRAGRTVTNPRNPAEKIEVPPLKVAKFRAGKTLKEALKGKEEVAPQSTPAGPAAAKGLERSREAKGLERSREAKGLEPDREEEEPRETE